MEEADLYVKSNTFQRNSTKRLLNEFAHLLKWRKDGCDSVLDIGCGPGDVTIDLILPILPPKFRHLIACDLSDRMIKYAEQYYRHPKVTYEKLDIREKVDEFLTKFGPFDHVVSFFCLHWVRDQKQAIGNVYKLLTTTGDCLLIFLTSAYVYTVYEKMSESEKWSKYMNDVELFVSPHHHTADPADNCRSLCQSIGFTSSSASIQEMTFTCENYDEFKQFYRSVNPFVNRIPVSEQDDFMEEIVQQIMKRNMEMNDPKYLISCNLVIIYAEK